MNLSIGANQSQIDDNLIYAAIRSIEKAITEDVPNQFHENYMETNKVNPCVGPQLLHRQ